MSAPRHKPVMLAEMIESIVPRDGGTYIDATFGDGGYARAILEAADCSVWAIDRDPDAVARAKVLASAYPDRFKILHGRFGDMISLLQAENISRTNGIVLDLGVSSIQFDEAERGFSFRFDADLDMRMSRRGATAADVVNNLDEPALARLIKELGEERFARRVARAIVEARGQAPITRTLQLADIVRRVVPRARDGIDPATRTFMALRVHVNDELGELDRALHAAETLLGEGGRLVVVAFNSLEDGRVKRFLRQRSRRSSGVSRHQPEPEQPRAPSFRLVRRRPLAPGEAEIKDNPRARSARLRVAERTGNPAWPPQPERIAA